MAAGGEIDGAPGEEDDALSRAKKHESRSAADKLLAGAKKKLSKGDLFGAYDDATRAISDGDPSEDIRQVQLLALARMGDTRRALGLFRSYGLDRARDPHKRALGARLLKDRALEAKSEKSLRAAYKAYRDIFAQTEDPYPGINAATMALLAGDAEEARWLATNILVHPTIDSPQDYYCAATRAEANLILGKPAAAADAIRLALTLPGGDVAARAGTQRQLSLLAASAGVPPADADPLIALLKAPAALHYCGHVFVADPDVEWAIMREIDGVLAARNAGFAYGSAAAGADILVAEAILARGGEVHIVLPCKKDDFVAQSVRPAGEAWVPRFEACLARASEVVYATEMEWVSDPALFGYNAAIAMGLAKLRAQHLSSDVFQLAIWDSSDGGPVGTGADVRLWQGKGGETVTLDPGPINRDYPRRAEATAPPFPRRLASILFTDYAGFSKLTESNLPKFDDVVMGRIADVLAQHDSILARNTWGDALYTVMESATAGAQIAHDLQRSLAQVDPAELGLPPGQGGMRIAVHYGSVYHTTDKVTGLPNFQGNEVARAARIEPITPPGAVYVTEPMAAMIALEAPDRFLCQYVGRIDLAKKYGTFPMYKLTGVGDAAPVSDEDEDSGDGDEDEAMTSEQSPRLFVSHHNSKLPVAEHVEKALNAKGVKCWVAPRDIDPGDQWDIAIRKAIADTDAVLLLFCSRSEKSRQVKRELILADQLGKAIIPLRLERIDPGELSYHLADSQWIDWLEQRDVVIDRIAYKAHEFQKHGPMETSPPVIEPARGSIDEVAPIDLTRPPSPMPATPPASVPIALDKPDRAPAPDGDRAGSADMPPRADVPPYADPAGTGGWPPTPDQGWPPAPPSGPGGGWPPAGTGTGTGSGRTGLYILLGLIGVILVVVLLYLVMAGSGDEDEPKARDSGEITEAWFAGAWSDYRNCRERVVFDRNGTFTTSEGETGTWRISDGGQLTAQGSDGTIEVRMRRVSDDEVALTGDLNGTSYRCD